MVELPTMGHFASNPEFSQGPHSDLTLNNENVIVLCHAACHYVVKYSRGSEREKKTKAANAGRKARINGRQKRVLGIVVMAVQSGICERSTIIKGFASMLPWGDYVKILLNAFHKEKVFFHFFFRCVFLIRDEFYCDNLVEDRNGPFLPAPFIIKSHILLDPSIPPTFTLKSNVLSKN